MITYGGRGVAKPGFSSRNRLRLLSWALIVVQTSTLAVLKAGLQRNVGLAAPSMSLPPHSYFLLLLINLYSQQFA